LLNGIWSDLPDVSRRPADDMLQLTTRNREDLSDGPGERRRSSSKGNNPWARSGSLAGLDGEYLFRIEAKLGATTYSGSQVDRVQLRQFGPKGCFNLTSGGGPARLQGGATQISGTSTQRTRISAALRGRDPNPGTFTALFFFFPIFLAPPIRLTALWAKPGHSIPPGTVRGGYVVVHNVWDGTIVNSGAIGLPQQRTLRASV
jgi:hypothetical protein